MINNFNGIENTSEYLRGMRDAKAGKPSEVGASDDYQDAYNLHSSSVEMLANMGLADRVSIFK